MEEPFIQILQMERNLRCGPAWEVDNELTDIAESCKELCTPHLHIHAAFVSMYGLDRLDGLDLRNIFLSCTRSILQEEFGSLQADIPANQSITGFSCCYSSI